MSVHYENEQATVYHGGCLEVMRTLPDDSVDSIVTDPPYGLGFMGKAWDALPPGLEWAAECLRVLKPGGHLLAFGGTRTWHRLALAIEDAGFEIRDSIAWMYGSGFPKHRAALKPAFEPIVMARKPFKGSLERNEATHGTGALNIDGCRIGTTDNRSRPPRTPNALYGGGAGTNLTASESNPAGRWPANVVLDEHAAEELDGQSGVTTSSATPRNNSARTNIAKGVEYANVTGGHSDSGGASRFFYVARKDEECPTNQPSNSASIAARDSQQQNPYEGSAPNVAVTSAHHVTSRQTGSPSTPDTRTGSKPNEASNTQPTTTIESAYSHEQQRGNVTPILSHANSAGSPVPTGTTTTTTSPSLSDGSAESITFNTTQKPKELGATGSDSLADAPFMYVAKAPKRERPVVDGVAHATVKPLALMRWLVRLVTPAGGTILEPFAGSGTTVEACILEGFHCIAIEREAEYLPLIQARIDRQAA